ncbi:cwf21 domain protein [Gregarina niphandrodes]|uniref:Cwf21 domain protein n=1 Tax=Gregarina niphandrodes TaxID=110365 RepID=A0A023B6K0_GRENI|nr:cwf21 domain protein [Gregarina niphandrodes]EZG66592.1 cwf21 domain protein [Gregarina niphandrodes]|eukprot:XP_011130578.1 cwf21 domain protein [Gregarina niphandrodes]
MFNGVGVPTARGTGTSGYVQGNKALLKGHPGNRKRQRDHKRIKEPEKDVVLIEHEKARIIEVAVLEYEDDLRESHPEMTEQEIEQKVRQKRNSLESDLLPQPHSDDIIGHQILASEMTIKKGDMMTEATTMMTEVITKVTMRMRNVDDMIMNRNPPEEVTLKKGVTASTTFRQKIDTMICYQ